MAEPFGIVAGTIGITSAFAACVDCFESWDLVGNSDETINWLSCPRLRLTLWGESVDIYKYLKLGKPNVSKLQRIR